MKIKGAANVKDGSDVVDNSGAVVDCSSLGDNVDGRKNHSDNHVVDKVVDNDHRINHTSVTDDMINNNLNVSNEIIESIDKTKTNNALHHHNSSNSDDNDTSSNNKEAKKSKSKKKSKKTMNSKEEVVENNNSVAIIDPLSDAKHIVGDDDTDNHEGGNHDNITLSNDNNNSIVLIDETKNSNSSTTKITIKQDKQSNEKTNKKINSTKNNISINTIDNSISDSINSNSISQQVNIIHKGRQLIIFGIPVTFNKKMFRTIATLGCPKTEVELLKEVRQL